MKLTNLIHTTNLIGIEMETKTFQFPDGAYDQYEHTLEDGGLSVYYQQILDRYMDIDVHVATESKAITEYKAAGQTCYLRQSCVRDRYDNVQIVTIPIVYIKRTRGKFNPIQTPISENTITCAFATSNPVLDSVGSYQYYPLIDGAVRIETIWKEKQCVFYLSKQDIPGTWDIFTLADENAQITIHGDVKSFWTTEERSRTVAKYINATNNTALQVLKVADMFGTQVDTEMRFNNVPNLCAIALVATISDETAQSIADLIKASEVFGDLYVTKSEPSYYSILEEAVDDNYRWELYPYQPPF